MQGKTQKTNNQWVKTSRLIHWDLIEKKYAANFKGATPSRLVKLARMAIGTQIIKEKLGFYCNLVKMFWDDEWEN